jgi:hypothetical protein
MNPARTIIDFVDKITAVIEFEKPKSAQLGPKSTILQRYSNKLG